MSAQLSRLLLLSSKSMPPTDPFAEWIKCHPQKWYTHFCVSILWMIPPGLHAEVKRGKNQTGNPRVTWSPNKHLSDSSVYFFYLPTMVIIKNEYHCSLNTVRMVQLQLQNKHLSQTTQIQVLYLLDQATHRYHPFVDLYERTHRWLTKHYRGNWEHTKDLQCFLERMQGEGVPIVRLRAMQSIVNHHLSPRPFGPPLRLVLRHLDKNTKKHTHDRTSASKQHLVWFVASGRCRFSIQLMHGHSGYPSKCVNGAVLAAMKRSIWSENSG